MTNAVQWRCRLLLGLVLLDVVLGSPVVKRQVVESLAQVQNEGPIAVDGNQQQAQLSEDTFGPNLQERGEREKRLFDLKKLGIGALGVKAAKAVGAKAVAAGAAAIKSKIVKAGAVAKAAAVGAVGLKAKAIGAKTLTAIAALGIKTLLFNLLFGKINKLIDYKERLLSALEQMNRVQNEAFHTNFFEIPKIVHPAPVKSAMRKAKRSDKNNDNYSEGKSKSDGGDAPPPDYGHSLHYPKGDGNYNHSHYSYNDEPMFLPPPRELNDTSLHLRLVSSSDYEDADNSSSPWHSSEAYVNNSDVNVLEFWRNHGALRWPLHRGYKQFLESKNMTVSDEAWSTEAVFGDDPEDYESPKTPNNSLETFNNDTNTTTDLSSNNIPVRRNYKLKRQKSFHNLKQFRKFYGRDPARDKTIELDKAFDEFKNDPQNRALDAYRLSKLFANKAYKQPFDYRVPKRYVPKHSVPTSSEEKEIDQNVLPNQLFPRQHFDPPLDVNADKDVIVYHEWKPPTTKKMSKSERREKAMELYDKFFDDVRLLIERVSEYFKR